MATIGELLEAKGVQIKPVQFDNNVVQKKIARDRRRNRNRARVNAKADLEPIIKRLASSPGFAKATLRGQERVLREMIQDCIVSDFGYTYKFYKKNWWRILIEATRAVTVA